MMASISNDHSVRTASGDAPACRDFATYTKRISEYGLRKGPAAMTFYVAIRIYTEYIHFEWMENRLRRRDASRDGRE